MNNWENGSKLREKPRIIGNILRKSREKQEKFKETQRKTKIMEENWRKLRENHEKVKKTWEN